MGEPAELTGRVTRLEHEMAEVRFLATKAEKDASDCKAVLIGHTGVLNAIREDQVDQGRKLAKIDTRLGNLETEVRSGFARVDERFAETREGFARVDAEARANFTTLAQGQERLTELMTRHISQCESGKEG